MSNKILVFGHKSPDTDSICSSIAYAELKKAKRIDAKAVRLGIISKETRYVLEYFGVNEQDYVTEISSPTDVILVDHNERTQTIDGIENANILEVVDHHRIGISTAAPIYYRCEPVGSTCTIIAKMYKEQGVVPAKEIAGLMLSAILSDTMIFKSPTCTDEDKCMALELADIAEVDPYVYGKNMIIAGASIEGEKFESVFTRDIKLFEFGDKKVLVSQVTTAGIESILAKKEEILSALEQIMEDEESDSIVLVLTDIILEGSELISVGIYKETIEQAFGLTEAKAFMPGVLSRKKQIIPRLTEVLS